MRTRRCSWFGPVWVLGLLLGGSCGSELDTSELTARLVVGEGSPLGTAADAECAAEAASDEVAASDLDGEVGDETLAALGEGIAACVPVDDFLADYLADTTAAEPACVLEQEPDFAHRVLAGAALDADPMLHESFYEGIFDAEAVCL